MTAVQDDLTEALLVVPDTSQDEPDLFEKLHADNQVRIAEADRVLSGLDALGEKIALRVAHARAEVLKQVRAQVLSIPGMPADQARELLGPFWSD